MIADPSVAKVEADLAEPWFRDGVVGGRWRVRAFAFPTLDVEVLGAGNDGKERWWGFKILLDNFPSQPPHARIWDFAKDAPLDAAGRPNWDQRVRTSFQVWGCDAVYRPWDRVTGPHGDNALKKPILAWRADRRLSFVLEDLHGLLNSLARRDGARTAA